MSGLFLVLYCISSLQGQTLIKNLSIYLSIYLSTKRHSKKIVIHRYWIKMWFFFHTYVLEKYCKDKLTIYHIYSPFTFINTMPICGITGVLGQSSRSKVNRSRPTYYDIDMDLHYVLRLYRPTTVDVIQYLDRERWIQCLFGKKKCYCEDCAGPNDSQVAFACDLCSKKLYEVQCYAINHRQHWTLCVRLEFKKYNLLYL